MKNHDKISWISRTDRPLTDVEIFINDFMTRHAETDEQKELLRKQFRSGYCWHFAHMLMDTFSRGQVVWAAPMSHVCWKDTDDKVYDVEGEYQGEAYYLIPEDFIMEISPTHMCTFRHLPNDSTVTSRDELIHIMKAYCSVYDKQYDTTVEHYFAHNTGYFSKG